MNSNDGSELFVICIFPIQTIIPTIHVFNSNSYSHLESYMKMSIILEARYWSEIVFMLNFLYFTIFPERQMLCTSNRIKFVQKDFIIFFKPTFLILINFNYDFILLVDWNENDPFGKAVCVWRVMCD